MKKARHSVLHVGIDENCREIDGIVIDENGISVISSDKEDIIRTLESEIYYMRNSKKKKVINKIPHVHFDSKENDFFSNYHIVCVADTNTKQYGNMSYSTSAFLIGMRDTEVKEEIQYSFITYIVGWESTGIIKPENYAWAVLISKVKDKETKEKGTPRIILLVDSDLGNHEAFNNQSLPIIDDFYLPKNFTLAYASADVGSEYATNQLIRFCDKEASLAMDEFIDEFIAEKER